VGSLVVSVLIVGILAGFSEELFFRGALQRLLSSANGIKPIAAIFISAFIFSFIHFQFYGFFPRLILGIYFGYLLYRTGSLWIPAIVHAFNNSLYIIGTRLVETNQTPTDINSIGVGSVWDVSFSIIVTLILLRVLVKITSNRESEK
ncbi:MAG: CPBP family intramembrane metalloprotease, partial [Muribaculaceae bacterium]|nr:CPBP family intramembrane metalloprotease [Muribaculaceae bacterium]